MSAEAHVHDLLFEIGCEEIPAKFLTRALAELPAQVEKKLADARLSHGGVQVLGTPRRLAIIVRGLAERQRDVSDELVGPPASAGFAPDGKLSKAGQGFVQKNGLDATAVTSREVVGKKGLYLVAQRTLIGEPTRGLLPALLATLVGEIAWAKSMRWGWAEVAFVRPIQWLVALYGAEVVPVEAYGHKATRRSRGHRYLHAGAVEVESAARYAAQLEAASVIVDVTQREQRVVAELARIENETGLRVRPDPGLVAETANLGEWPVAVCGQFDPSFLLVPEEIIVTAMRNHQRYFALEDSEGRLAPRFVTIAATTPPDLELVQKGNAKVLASRLSDAKFFFAEDGKKALAELTPRLDTVVFQAKLGERARTIGDKVRRLERAAAAIAGVVANVDAATVKAAAQLCKSDLSTGVVGEFPELQGTMGKHYAVASLRKSLGDHAAEAIGAAIEQHYWPKGQGAALPTSAEGAIVGLADRMDTLVGCFASGLQPSGSADPLGLRRAAIGVLAILLDRQCGGPRHVTTERWDQLDLEGLIALSADAYDDTLAITPAARKELADFVRSRLRGLLVDDGLAAQDVDAALAARWNWPGDARLRAQALGVIPAAAREVFKRIANILDDATAKQLTVGGEVKPALFVAPDGAEARLWTAFASKEKALAEAAHAQRYRDMFHLLVEIQPVVAAFFDTGSKGGVMVMDPDPALRDNRLAILAAIRGPFMRIADFRIMAAPATSAGVVAAPGAGA